MDHVFKLHGLPQAIISDRDRVFTSALWKELFRLVGVELRMSTAYHPQMVRQNG
jgi:transposase InsO family protein